MKEVGAKIDELIELLEKKVQSTEVLNQQLSSQKAGLEERERVLIAKDKRLSALERIYSKYDDFEEQKKAFAKERQEFLDSKDGILAQEDEIKKSLEKLNAENQVLDNKKKALSKQAIALKEREAEFDKKRQELKDVISGTAVKNLLK